MAIISQKKKKNPTEKSYKSDNLYPPLEIRHEPMPAYSLQQKKKLLSKSKREISKSKHGVYESMKKEKHTMY